MLLNGCNKMHESRGQGGQKSIKCSKGYLKIADLGGYIYKLNQRPFDV